VACLSGAYFRMAHFLLFVCLPVFSVCRHSFRSLVIGRSIDQCPEVFLPCRDGDKTRFVAPPPPPPPPPPDPPSFSIHSRRSCEMRIVDIVRSSTVKYHRGTRRIFAHAIHHWLGKSKPRMYAMQFL